MRKPSGFYPKKPVAGNSIGKDDESMRRKCLY
jgi:hypothetical protein